MRTASASDSTDGRRLYDHALERIAERGGSISVQAQDCLWACARSCTALVQAPHKMGYLLGGLQPNATTATALMAWCAAVARSEDGNVAFHDWPEELKGHFIARLPADMPEEGANGKAQKDGS